MLTLSLTRRYGLDCKYNSLNEIAEGGRNDHPLFYFEESNKFVSDAGLETEGMATSTAKLQESLKQLAGVDILEDGGTAFKSTFQIMRELAGAWDNISDMNRANSNPYVQKCA